MASCEEVEEARKRWLALEIFSVLPISSSALRLGVAAVLIMHSLTTSRKRMLLTNLYHVVFRSYLTRSTDKWPTHQVLLYYVGTISTLDSLESVAIRRQAKTDGVSATHVHATTNVAVRVIALV